MKRAVKRVVKNKGAPGVDGMTVRQVKRYLLRPNLSDPKGLSLIDPAREGKSCQKRFAGWQLEEGLRIDRVFQDFHRFDKITVSNGNDHIDRVEVFLTIEAAGQVGFVVCGRMKAVANRASEPKQFTVVSYLKI
jgi:hypothetical protein